MVSAVEATVEVKNRLGLHLRAASVLAETVGKFSAAVDIAHGKDHVNARSVTGLIMLGAAKGTKLKVKAEGPDARAAIAAVRALFDNRFGED